LPPELVHLCGCTRSVLQGLHFGVQLIKLCPCLSSGRLSSCELGLDPLQICVGRLLFVDSSLQLGVALGQLGLQRAQVNVALGDLGLHCAQL